MDDFFIDIYITNEFYKNLILFEITYFIGIVIASSGAFLLFQKVFERSISKSDDDQNLYTEMSNEGFEIKIIILDFAFFSVIFLLSIIFAYMASSAYSIDFLKNPQLENTKTVILGSQYWFCTLIIVGAFEVVFLPYYKLKTSFNMRKEHQYD